jgi:hypothetical protein
VSEALPQAPAGIVEALGWRGSALDDAAGRAVGRVEGVYADAAGGAPVWLVVALARGGLGRLWRGRRGAKKVLVPLRECAAMPGRVWTAQGREAIRGAPTVDPSRPLLREHEAAICAHYGIGDSVGRHAELAGHAAAAVTAQPAH